MMLSLTACSIDDLKPREEDSKKYSEIKAEAYKDKSEIDYQDGEKFMRAAAGMLTYLDDGDKDGMKKLLANAITDNDDFDKSLDEMISGFEGDITDTTPLKTDFTCSVNSQWSKNEPKDMISADFYVYTDKGTYRVNMGLCSVDKMDANGADAEGIYFLEVRSIGSYYYYSQHYEEIEPTYHVDTIGNASLYFFSDYAFDGSDYSVYNLTNTQTGYDVYKKTGSKDAISMDKLKSIDYTDKSNTSIFDGMEPYVENVGTNRIFNIEDSDKKALLYYNEDGFRKVQVIDIETPLNEQEPEVIYDKKKQ